MLSPYTGRYTAESLLGELESTSNGSAKLEYDGEGRRVRKITCGTPSNCTAGTGGAVVTVYVYDAMGNLAAEYGPINETGTKYLFPDALGSTRVTTDGGGTTVRRYDYAPFGEELTSARTSWRTTAAGYYGADSFPLKFTGKERDTLTELDYFGARYYGSSYGRFESPDAPLVDQHAEDPQSWNLYAYVRNNPLRYVDPNGRAYCAYNNGGIPYGGAATTAETCAQGGGTWVFQPTDMRKEWDAPAFNFSTTVTESTGELSADGQAVVDQLGANADSSIALITTVAGGSAAAGATAALIPAAGQAINELAFGPATGRLFWAGGQVAAEAATASGSGRVIGQSPLGELFARLTSSLSYSLQRPGWALLSRFWASGAAGTVNVFPRSPHPNSLLMRVELPVLLRNPNVFKPLQYR